MIESIFHLLKIHREVILGNSRVHPAVALQKPKYNVFPGSPSATLTLSSAAKVRLINLNFSIKFARLKLCDMIDRLTQALVDAAHYLVIKAEVTCHSIRRLLLVEAGQDANLFTQSLMRLLFSTGLVPAPDVPALRLRYLKRTAKNALSAPQKVGRTVENVLLPSNHKGIVAPRGYETH